MIHVRIVREIVLVGTPIVHAAISIRLLLIAAYKPYMERSFSPQKHFFGISQPSDKIVAKEMAISKHLKLFRKLLGTVARPRVGVKNKMMKLFKFCYLLFSWPIEILGDSLSSWKRFSNPTLIDLQRILIVKTDQLGDVMFSTLLLPAIRARYPDAKIDYLVRPNARQLLEKNPNVAEVYHWNSILLEFLPGRGDRRHIWAKIKSNCSVKRILRANSYDLVINARAYPPSSNLPLRKLGRKLIAFDISEQSFLADYWAKYDLDEGEVVNYANLLNPLDIDTQSVLYSKEFYNHNARNPMEGVRRYAVVSPVSFEVDRQWKREYWKRLIVELVSKGIHVALTGTPAHKTYLEEIAPLQSEADGAVCTFIDLKLPEFGSLVKDATFFVGIDSFPAHLAIALGRRSALLVNPDVYYLKGYSSKKFANEARSMLPTAQCAAFFNVRTAEPNEVVAYFSAFP